MERGERTRSKGEERQNTNEGWQIAFVGGWQIAFAGGIGESKKSLGWPKTGQDTWRQKLGGKSLEVRGIDPRTSRMLSERSTI